MKIVATYKHSIVLALHTHNYEKYTKQNARIVVK